MPTPETLQDNVLSRRNLLPGAAATTVFLAISILVGASETANGTMSHEQDSLYAQYIGYIATNDISLKLVLPGSQDLDIMPLSVGIPANDHELATDQIERLYHATFNRTPETEGLNFHLGRYASEHISLQKVAEVFTDSIEWRQKYHGLSNHETIVEIYKNVFNREPDTTGLSYWTNRLNSGEAIESIIVAISETPEHVEITNTLPRDTVFYYPNEIHYGNQISGPKVIITPLMERVRHCESKNIYIAQNNSSSASGGWQFIRGTWRGALDRLYVKYPWLSDTRTEEAKHATPALQDAAAHLMIIEEGNIRAWNASRGCWE